MISMRERQRERHTEYVEGDGPISVSRMIQEERDDRWLVGWRVGWYGWGRDVSASGSGAE